MRRPMIQRSSCLRRSCGGTPRVHKGRRWGAGVDLGAQAWRLRAGRSPSRCSILGGGWGRGREGDAGSKEEWDDAEGGEEGEGEEDGEGVEEEDYEGGRRGGGRRGREGTRRKGGMTRGRGSTEEEKRMRTVPLRFS